MPDWFDDPGKRKEKNRRSKEQEKTIAEKIGGKRQAGSGSSEFAPQDVINDDHLVQIKYTDSTTFRLRITEWNKLKEDALRYGREPIMVIEFPTFKTKLVIREWNE